MSHKAGSVELHSDQSHGRRVENRRNSVTTMALETEHDCDQRYRQVKYELSEKAEVGSLWLLKLFIWRCVDVGEHINNRNNNRKTALLSHHSCTTSRTWNKTFWSFPTIQRLGGVSVTHQHQWNHLFHPSFHLSFWAYLCQFQHGSLDRPLPSPPASSRRTPRLKEKVELISNLNQNFKELIKSINLKI